MPQPKTLVSCVLLSCGTVRAAMKERAIRSYESQTYENRELIVYEGTGRIGALRNAANALSHGSIICHFDEDDWSAPQRVAEQVALLESTGADCVGINEMIFWQSPATVENWKERAASGESQIGLAWLYSNHIPPNYVLGTSLCYWRKAWEAHPFDDINQGEDMRFVGKVKTVGVSALSVGMDGTSRGCARCFSIPCMCEPRMITSIHGGNTSPFDPEKGAMCRRVPQWDAYCSERMALCQHE